MDGPQRGPAQHQCRTTRQNHDPCRCPGQQPPKKKQVPVQSIGTGGKHQRQHVFRFGWFCQIPFRPRQNSGYNCPPPCSIRQYHLPELRTGRVGCPPLQIVASQQRRTHQRLTACTPNLIIGPAPAFVELGRHTYIEFKIQLRQSILGIIILLLNPGRQHTCRIQQRRIKMLDHAVFCDGINDHAENAQQDCNRCNHPHNQPCSKRNYHAEFPTM